MKFYSFKDIVLAAIVSTLIIGSLVIAIIDENYRSTFVDLTKVGVSGYIGFKIPKS